MLLTHADSSESTDLGEIATVSGVRVCKGAHPGSARAAQPPVQQCSLSAHKCPEVPHQLLQERADDQAVLSIPGALLSTASCKAILTAQDT